MPDKFGKLRLSTAIVCDDARREEGGKEILIGVYSGSIVLHAFPTQLPLVFWMSLEPVKDGVCTIEFRIFNTDDSNASAPPPLQIAIPPDSDNISIGLGVGSIAISKPGSLRLQMRQNNEKWQAVKSIKVMDREHVPKNKITVSSAL